MEPNNNFTPTPTGDNGKTAGIISYLTIVGWLIAFFAMHKDSKTDLGSYQLRQTLLFHIVSMVLSWVLGIIFAAIFFSSAFGAGWSIIALLSWAVRIGFFIMWVIGFIGAVNGEKKPIPLIGEKAQSVFSTI
jgi:uncharacterized membrane protein